MSAVDYTNLTAVRADLPGMTSTDSNAAISAAITAASREIEQRCGTTFYPVTEARVFDSYPDGTVIVDRFTSTVGLVVATGPGGVYSTTLTADQYVLGPRNAPSRGKAYSEIEVPSVRVYFGDGWPGVQVTASWGWDYIPAQIEQATRLRALQMFHRRESPHGSASYGDDPASADRVMAADPDIAQLLDPFIVKGFG